MEKYGGLSGERTMYGMSSMGTNSVTPMDNGSPPPPLESLSKTLTPTLPTPNATAVQILVTTGSPAPCTPVPHVGKPCRVMLHIIVWRPNVISVTNGDTLTRYATFESVGDATPPDTWSITVQSARLSNQKFATYGGTYSNDDDLNTLVDDN